MSTLVHPMPRLAWDAPCRVTRALTFEISPQGRLMATTSLSRPLQEVSYDALMVLRHFAGGATPRQALEALRGEWAVDKVEFGSIVEHLQGEGLLIPEPSSSTGDVVTAVPAAASFETSSSLPTHHALLTDVPRVMAYQRAITQHCADKMVVEVGCGSGILSILAAKAGARKVIAIEEMEIADLAARMIEANGCDDRVELRRANSRDVELEEPADVIVHEIFGVDPFEENLLPALNDARRRFLKSGGRLLPHRVEVFCLGLEVEEPAHHDKGRVLEEAEQLHGLYGLDFGPYLDVLRDADPQVFPRPFPSTDPSALFRPRVLSEPCRLLDLDLYAESPDVEAQLANQRLHITRRGTLNGLILYFKAHLDATTVLSTSPFAPLTTWGRRVTPVGRPAEVSAGQLLGLDSRLETRRGKQMLRVHVAGRERG